MPKRVLLLASTTGYQTRMFGEAAERLGVKLIFATDCCDQLDDPWWDGAIPVRFHREEASVDAILASKVSFDGILAVGDRPTIIAAAVAERLGVPGHSRQGAITARDKRLTRTSLSRAGLPVPWFRFVPRTADPRALAQWLSWPIVVKPASLSGSRGVMRVDSRAQFVEAFDRLRRLLDAPDVLAARDPATGDIILEGFIEGREYAVEGVLEHGHLRTLAIFDKPDPLNGPFFEETIYVTPSRAEASQQADICATVAAAARALGLYHGPIHAECRVNPDGVFVLEVAARPIGGLCAKTLMFRRSDAAHAGLEELLLRHALGELVDAWHREDTASGVMMIPIPSAGVYRRVEGLHEAAAVPHVSDVRITAKPDQQLVPLPEGSSYLGFIFAKAESGDEVELALRQAHGRLSFVIDRPLPVI